MSIPFVEPGTLHGSNIYGAGVQLGNTALAAESFTGQLLVRNISAQTIPVTTSLQCGEARAALASGNLAPGETRRLAVAADAITCESGAVGIEVTSPVKGSLLGRWLSIGQSSGLVVETAIHSVGASANLSGSDPWMIDEETSSILYVQNVGSAEASFMPVIHYSQHEGHGTAGTHSDERYVVGLKRLQPGETVAIDIRALRDNQTPDVAGRVLPAAIRSGQIHWLRRHGPAIVANVLTVNSTKRIASAFSFFCCYCSPRQVFLSLDPDNVEAYVGQTVVEDLWETLVDCHGMPTSYPVPLQEAYWSTSNFIVAPVVAPGWVWCTFPGNATITAEKSVVWYDLDYTIGEGDPCYLDGWCYGAPACQSFEGWTYASANFNVTWPPWPVFVNVTFGSQTVLPAGQTTVTVTTFPPAVGQAITLTPGEVPLSGSHNHTNRPSNTFYASPTGVTDANGTFQTTFTASNFAGAETVTATVQGVSGTGTLSVAVQGLVQLSPGTNYNLTGNTPWHILPANHYGTPTANAALVSIANQYAAFYPGSILLYNDQSLPLGGLFDIGPPDHTFWNPPHMEHRFGINCDVSKGNVPQVRWQDLRDIFVQFGSGNYLEHDNHWHLRFQ